MLFSETSGNYVRAACRTSRGWLPLQYGDCACNRKKHITGACDIIENGMALNSRQRKRAGHSALTFRVFDPRLELLTYLGNY